jgi:copper transport protein
LWHRLLTAGLLAASVMSSPVPAAAHAVLVRADPASNAALQTAPRQVTLWFSETVDARFSSVLVTDNSGRAVSRGAAASPDGQRLMVSLPNLPQGVYAVRWRVLSSADGHTTSGAFVFAVGLSLRPTGPPAEPATPPPLLIVVRWIGFAAALLIVGTATFPPVIFRPALRRIRIPGGDRLLEVAETRLRRVMTGGAGVLLLSLIAELVIQTETLLGADSRAALTGGMLWPLMAGTKLGWGFLIRSGLTMVLLLPIAWRRRARLAWVPPLAAGGILLGFTITAHASGRGLVAMAADWAHLAAAGLWLGGLGSLLLALRAAPRPERESLAKAIVPRFSTLAGLCLGSLLVTGLYGVWLQVRPLRAFTLTPYGRTLLLKFLLILPAVGLGALNRFSHLPRLAQPRKGSGPILRALLRAVGGEVGIGAGILLVVAALTITPPPATSGQEAALSGGEARSVVLAGLAGDLRVRLTLTPAQAGWYRYEVTIEGGALPSPRDTRVMLRLAKLDEDLAPTTIALAPKEPAHYGAEGGELALPGWWQVDVVVRRGGRPDVTTTFPLRLGESRARPDPAAQRLLQRAVQTGARLRAWRETEQITDGNGGVVVTHYEAVPPDRMRYQTSGGTEVIMIRDKRYDRSDHGTWEQVPLTPPLTVSGPAVYFREAEHAALGRRSPCDQEVCQIVFWDLSGSSTAFAGWIGTQTGRAHQVLMVAPSHYMTLQYRDFDVQFQISAPK